MNVAVDQLQGIDLSADELADVEQAKRVRKMMIQEYVETLVSKRDAIVRAKRHIEKRWIDDLRQIDGDNRLMNTKEFPSQTNDDNMRPPVPHFTRARCDLWESRMVDLLAPTADPTWDLKPLIFQHMDMDPTVDPMILQKAADQAAQSMKNVIRDQFAACSGQKVIRKMCRDATRIGTGLVIGPVNGTHVRRHFDGAKLSVRAIETTSPEIREGDPWCFFPDMVDSAEKAEYAFYVHFMSELDLWKFASFPGVDRAEVIELMKEKPVLGEIETSVRERNQYSGYTEEINNKHAVWRYTGLIDREYLDILNIDGAPDEGPVCADIWFANDHILRAKVTALSSVNDFRIPYFVFSPFPIDDTMFGGSVPYLCRDSQRMATSALWIMLHNASVSSGPQVLFRRGKVRPMDGKWSLRGPKLWDVIDSEADMDNLFRSINIENNVEQALGIYNLAKQQMDEELSTQQWASPDTSEEVETASGLAMLMNARTILQRRVCASADDDVYRPMIERFVLWNLIYNNRPDIKGDFEVLPLCQSVRLVKDIQIQQKLFVATQLAPSNPGMFDQYDMIKDIIRDLDVQVSNWLVSKEDWQKAQQMQQQQQSQQQAEIHAQQMQLLEARTTNERAKAAKAFNEAQQPPQSGGDGSPAGLSPDKMLSHQEFLIEKEFQTHQEDSRAAQALADNETKRMQIAAQAQQAANNNRQTVDANLRRERIDLFKTAFKAKADIQKAKVKAAPAGPQTKPAKGTFKAPAIRTYRGGKR